MCHPFVNLSHSLLFCNAQIYKEKYHKFIESKLVICSERETWIRKNNNISEFTSKIKVVTK